MSNNSTEHLKMSAVERYTGCLYAASAYRYEGREYAFFRARFDNRRRWHRLDKTGLPITHRWRVCEAPYAVRKFAGFPKSRACAVNLNADLHS